MGRSQFGLLVFGLLLTAIPTFASADDARAEAIKKDRKQIEGTWQVVALVVDGNKAMEQDVKKLSVFNGSDGTWSLRVDGLELSRGTNVFDPLAKPKSIDFTPTEGEGKGDRYLGIYEFGDNTRKLCFAPADKPRPTEFSSVPGSGRVLVVFEREKDK